MLVFLLEKIVEKNKKHTLLLGGHMSIAGGMYKAILRGEEINCTAIQVFIKSNRQWGGKDLTEQYVKRFKDAWRNSPCVKSIVGHSTYLINLGSPKKDVFKKSVCSLEDEVQRCIMLGIPYLVLHPGSHLGAGEDKCLKQIANALDEVLEKNHGTFKILLETMAGQGTGVCYKFDHIAEIFGHMKHKRRLGVCFDTCHVFAAGYDFRTKKGYERVIEAFDKIIGLHRLKVMHINDSVKDLGGRVDRHADIGKGKIGKAGFWAILHEPKLKKVNIIIETPENDDGNDIKNIKTLKKLRDQKKA